MLNDLSVTHQKWVRPVNGEMSPHTFHFGAFDRNFSIIPPFNQHAINPIDGTIASNHTQLEFDSAELIWSQILFVSQFKTSRAVDLLEHPPTPQIIHYLTSLIWRAEHHNPAQSRVTMTIEVTSHQQTSQGMCDKVNFGIGCKPGA